MLEKFIKFYLISLLSAGFGYSTTFRVPEDYPTIQSAIDIASSGDTILVASGFYNERILIQTGIILLSEYGPDSTVISSSGLGGGQGSEVLLVYVPCTVNGFKIQSDDPNTFGIFILGADSTTVIENNIIENMTYSAIGCSQASPLIRRNLLEGSAQAGIILNTNSMPTIINNTIVSNLHGIAIFTDSNPTIINNIIVNNNYWGIASFTGSATANSYNDVWNNIINNYGGNSQAGIGDISVNPLFEGGNPFNYHLQSISPCIDSGDPTTPLDPDSTRTDIGAYYYDQSQANINYDPLEKTLQYILTQNYPNPFNPTTKIQYSVPQYSNVTLKVFDVLGNEIETLVNEEKQTGTYEIIWDAKDSPNGVYFYQLKAGNYISTKKMVLLK